MVVPCTYDLSPGSVMIGGAFVSSGSVIAGGAFDSSSRIVPVAVPVVTSAEVPNTARLTMNVSSASTAVSSVVETVKFWISPATPVNVSPEVFRV